MHDQTLSSSLEDYLETILHLQQEHSVARAKEIGDHLHVNRSSVTTALQALAKRGLVFYTPYGFITLTPSGKAAAENVAERHEVMRQFLVRVLCIDEATADADACKLEHSLSEVVLERLVAFLEFVARCPAGVADWAPSTGFHCTHSAAKTEAICDKCTSRYAKPRATRRPTRKRPA